MLSPNDCEHCAKEAQLCDSSLTHQSASSQALSELWQKYEDLQRDVQYIKEHLKLSALDKCTANGTTLGKVQHPSTVPSSARIWIFGGHDGSDWLSDSRIFHIHKCVQLFSILVLFVS